MGRVPPWIIECSVNISIYVDRNGYKREGKQRVVENNPVFPNFGAIQMRFRVNPIGRREQIVGQNETVRATIISFKTLKIIPWVVECVREFAWRHDLVEFFKGSYWQANQRAPRSDLPSFGYVPNFDLKTIRRNLTLRKILKWKWKM